MENKKYYLAIDIGASSGRGIIGYLENGKLVLDETYRFKNGPKNFNNSLIWDIDEIYQNVLETIKASFAKYNKIEAMSIDTWGVDYVLMKGDKVIYPVYCYRDNRCKGIIDEVHSKISQKELYEITGCQFQEFNTIYQLYDDLKKHRLDEATTFMHIPEYLMYKLTNVESHEYTNASTTCLLDRNTNYYSDKILTTLNLKKSLFHPLSKPKKVLGRLTSDVSKYVNGNTTVKLCATHDTASAVEAIKMERDSLYISSGTWSLLGMKNDVIINSDVARCANYSNEYGPNYFRLQKNIMGLWIIQNLSKELNMDFVSMIDEAKKSSYTEIYDVNDSVFLNSSNMKDEIINYFKKKGVTPPQLDSDIINSTYHSLAYSYDVAIKQIEEISQKVYEDLYIVGGGAKNNYLNELTKKYTNKNVIALPIEATAIGNLYTIMEE